MAMFTNADSRLPARTGECQREGQSFSGSPNVDGWRILPADMGEKWTSARQVQDSTAMETGCQCRVRREGGETVACWRTAAGSLAALEARWRTGTRA